MTTEDMQKLGKGSMDMAMTAAGAWSKTAQAIAVEFVDYTKRSAESSTAAWEKLARRQERGNGNRGTDRVFAVLLRGFRCRGG